MCLHPPARNRTYCPPAGKAGRTRSPAPASPAPWRSYSRENDSACAPPPKRSCRDDKRPVLGWEQHQEHFFQLGGIDRLGEEAVHSRFLAGALAGLQRVGGE